MPRRLSPCWTSRKVRFRQYCWSGGSPRANRLDARNRARARLLAHRARRRGRRSARQAPRGRSAARYADPRRLAGRQSQHGRRRVPRAGRRGLGQGASGGRHLRGRVDPRTPPSRSPALASTRVRGSRSPLRAVAQPACRACGAVASRDARHGGRRARRPSSACRPRRARPPPGAHHTRRPRRPRLRRPPGRSAPARRDCRPRPGGAWRPRVSGAGPDHARESDGPRPDRARRRRRRRRDRRGEPRLSLGVGGVRERARASFRSRSTRAGSTSTS